MCDKDEKLNRLKQQLEEIQRERDTRQDELTIKYIKEMQQRPEGNYSVSEETLKLSHQLDETDDELSKIQNQIDALLKEK